MAPQRDMKAPTDRSKFHTSAKLHCLACALDIHPKLVMDRLNKQRNSKYGVRLRQLQITGSVFQIAVDVQMCSLIQ